MGLDKNLFRFAVAGERLDLSGGHFRAKRTGRCENFDIPLRKPGRRVESRRGFAENDGDTDERHGQPVEAGDALFLPTVTLARA
ncbi:hypothetical protein ACFQ1S_04885, partial [Kibdelosporangium lantanae]